MGVGGGTGIAARWALRGFAVVFSLSIGGPLRAEHGIATPIQIIADITAIQATCRDLEVRPGVAFRYIESHGVRMVDVLPGGRRRDEFDAAFARSSMIDRSELCSSVAARYAGELPGVVERR